MNRELAQWLAGANDRIHGTTKAKPNELFAKEEAKCLLKLPLEPFDISSFFWSHT